MFQPLILSRKSHTSTFDTFTNTYATTEGTPTDLAVNGNIQFMETRANSLPPDIVGFKDRPVIANVYVPNTLEVRTFLAAGCVIVDNDTNSTTYGSQYDPIKPPQGKKGATSIQIECLLKRVL